MQAAKNQFVFQLERAHVQFFQKISKVETGQESNKQVLESQTARIQDQQGLISNVVRQMQELSTIVTTQGNRISALQAELITLKNPAETIFKTLFTTVAPHG